MFHSNYSSIMHRQESKRFLVGWHGVLEKAPSWVTVDEYWKCILEECIWLYSYLADIFCLSWSVLKLFAFQLGFLYCLQNFEFFVENTPQKVEISKNTSLLGILLRNCIFWAIVHEIISLFCLWKWARKRRKKSLETYIFKVCVERHLSVWISA